MRRHLEELNADSGENKQEEKRHEHDVVNRFHSHDHTLYDLLKYTEKLRL